MRGTCGHPIFKEHQTNRLWCAECRGYAMPAPVEPEEKNDEVEVTKPKRKGPNRTELRYRTEVIKQDYDDIVFEGLGFLLANGHRYTPDWVGKKNGTVVECVEVKSRGKNGFRHPSYQRARLAFDQAKLEWPGILWTWAELEDGKWKIT